jgi:pimeloyl-ACP methyl ester carboxylesterase
MTPSDDAVGTAAGTYAVATYAGDSAPVLAIPGATSTNRLWLWLHEAAPWATLVAPDLPGRGLTPARPGRRSSVGVHADELVGLLDELGLGTVDVLGMSMGGFVAVELAARHPDRVRSLTLLDGGLPVPASLPEHVVEQTFRSQHDDTDWPDVTAYAERLVSTGTPMIDPTDPRFLQMCVRDLTRGADGGRVRRDLETVVADAVSVLASARPAEAFAEVQAPTRLLYAQWARGEGTDPMYPAEHVATFSQLVRADHLALADHAGVVMTDSGAAAGAALLRASLDGIG